MKAALHLGDKPAHEATYNAAPQCVAGFFASQAQAQAAAHQLQQQHGLHADQELLLGPAQSSWLSFARQSRVWTGRGDEARAGLADAPLMAACGAFVAGLFILIGLALEGVPVDGPLMFMLLIGPLAGALAGWIAATLMAGPAQHRRFNRHIRQQLAAGGWVVLAHHMPMQQQAGAAALLRTQGVGWCAMYPPWRPL